MNGHNVYVSNLLKIKLLTWSAAGKGKIQEVIKNEGYSHDVIENTCRKDVAPGYSHDVDENKRLIAYKPRCL